MGTYKGPLPPQSGGVERPVAGGQAVYAGTVETTDSPSTHSNDSNNTPSTPQMRPNLTGRDRSFSDFAYPAQIGTPTTPPPGRPLAPQSTGSNNPFLANSSSPRRPSTISTGSEYDPGADLSSFDASTTRAMPGYRGALGTILDGWAEEGDNGGVIPKTWQEEQERRMEAERELHRRRERAEQEEMERKLGEEFWRGEEERFGPVVPEKIRPHSTGTGVPISGNGPTMRGGNLDGSFMGTNRTHIVPSSAPVAHNFYSSAAPQSQQDFLLTQEQPTQQPQQLPAEQPSGAQPLTEQPPVPQVDGNTSTQPDTTSQPPPGRNPTADAYQIKHITWVDPVTSQTRRSPILLQNENGPCPLLALVNALTLSTPADSPTALIEALRVREHVSLGLLLDAVFDGVVTRASTQGVEVDMSDLFAFLMSLSTGMNVNPRFVFPTTPSGEDGPPQLLGSFEQTKEMRLYNSFGVPLYHGWLPAPGERVYKVLQKAAPTYEEVQNLILHEEIILHRISTAPQGFPEGELSGGEGPVIEDAGIIRTWLDESCTQLTNWGLESLTRYWGGNISDGRGAGLGRMGILFRNDHFCTVMKGRIPGREEALLSLVTDMGYGGYEEVVWESLVSVSGEGGDFWTGDYRPVGGGDGGHVPRTGQHVRSLLDVDDDAGWETVGGQRRRGARGVRQQQDQQQRYQQPTQQNQQQHQQQQHQQQGTPPQRRSFVDALLGRGGAQQSAQASLWHQPTGPQPRRGSSTTTHPNNNSLPNSQIPAPMLPPRTSSRTENTTPAPPTHSSALDDLSPLREAIPEPQRQEEHSTDYDLALAMQLQEEEDERERQRVERQRRHQSAPAGPPPPTPVTQFAPPPGPPPTQSLHRTPTQPSHRIPPQTQHRMQPEEQPRNMDGSGRDVPPPPYEQHAQDQRPPVSAPYVPHQRQQHPGTSAPELARFNSVSFRPDSGYDPNVTFGNMFGNVQNQNQGGAGSGTTPGSLGRRRSELHRRGQDARGMLNEFINNGGSGAGGAGVPGGYARAGAGAGPGGPGGGGGGSLKQGKDCVIM